MEKMKLSIVTTLYYSAPYINEFYERCKKSIPQEFTDHEFVFVNDGSPDNSLEKALELHEKNNNVKVINLSRNFGHHKAIMAGLQQCTGDYVFLIDVDLEEEPELLKSFWKEMQANEQFDVVYGVQQKRKGNWFEKSTGSFFYGVFNFFSETKITSNMSTIRLMNRKYCNALLMFEEREFVLGGVFQLVGFQQKNIFINKHSTSKTTYNLKRKVAMAINAISSFSNKPLVIIFYIGGIITLISFFFIVFLLIKKYFLGVAIGWTSIIASIWFLGGLIIFAIGIIGIYLSKIFTEVKQRPNHIIKKIYKS